MKLHDQHRAIFPNPRCVDCGAPVILGECSAAAKQRRPAVKMREEHLAESLLRETSKSFREVLNENEELKADKEKARRMLVQLEFANRGYCFFCAGWDNSSRGNGETPGKHRYDCPLKKLLKETK